MEREKFVLSKYLFNGSFIWNVTLAPCAGAAISNILTKEKPTKLSLRNADGFKCLWINKYTGLLHIPS